MRYEHVLHGVLVVAGDAEHVLAVPVEAVGDVDAVRAVQARHLVCVSLCPLAVKCLELLKKHDFLSPEQFGSRAAYRKMCYRIFQEGNEFCSDRHLPLEMENVALKFERRLLIVQEFSVVREHHKNASYALPPRFLNATR